MSQTNDRPPEAKQVSRDPAQIRAYSLNLLRQLRERVQRGHGEPYIAARIDCDGYLDIVGAGLTPGNYLSLVYEMARIAERSLVAELEKSACCEFHRAEQLRYFAAAQAIAVQLETLGGYTPQKSH